MCPGEKTGSLARSDSSLTNFTKSLNVTDPDFDLVSYAWRHHFVPEYEGSLALILVSV